jgi:hypothetical protein
MTDAARRDTEVIDKLFLELSQFSQATTAREAQLLKERDILLSELARTKIALADAERAGIETPQSIADWANSTFGSATIERQVERAEEEWAEYYKACEQGRSAQERAIEIADTIICLSRVLVQLGYPKAVDEKMAINRIRRWKVDGEGCAYHVEAQAGEVG